MKTNDGGSTWNEVLYRINGRFGNLHFWDDRQGIAISQGERDSADIFMTNDAGESWDLVFPRPYARSPIDNSLYFFDKNSGWFASSNQGQSPPRNASIVVGSLGGTSWQPSDAGSRNIAGMAFLTPYKGWAIDNVQYGARRTINGGASWSSTYWPTNGLRSVAICSDPVSKTLWIVTDTSAWFSQNEGGLWTRTQMVPVGPLHTAVFADSIHGWAVTRSGIVQRLARSPFVTSAEQPVAREKDVRLGHGYPNPLTNGDAAMLIPFSLPSPSHVLLKLYNSAGKDIATLVDGTVSEGEHTVAWDAGTSPNGTYFYTLTTKGVVMTGRCTILR